MITTSYTSGRRKVLAAVIDRVLTAEQHDVVRAMVRAESSKGSTAQAEDTLYWLRLNMPTASGRIEHILYPHD